MSWNNLTQIWDPRPGGFVTVAPDNAAFFLTLGPGTNLQPDPSFNVLTGDTMPARFVDASLAPGETTPFQRNSVINTTTSIRTNADPVAENPCFLQAPPGFTKSFKPDQMATGQVSRLTFTIDNTANAAPVNGLDFTDSLPADVIVRLTPKAETTCTGGTLTAVGGSGMITYSGGTVAAGATCTVAADVTSNTLGDHDNTSGALTSSAGTSGTATDTLTVADPVPTLGEWALILLALLLTALGVASIRRMPRYR